MTTVLRKFSIIAAMILTMSGLMTAIMTCVSLPADANFLTTWLPLWLRAAVIIAPCGFVFLTILGRAIDLLLPKTSTLQKRLLQGLGMVLVMETIMATVTTVQMHGWDHLFAAVWFHAMAAALPFGILMSALMTFVIKPRMDAVITA